MLRHQTAQFDKISSEVFFGCPSAPWNNPPAANYTAGLGGLREIRSGSTIRVFWAWSENPDTRPSPPPVSGRGDERSRRAANFLGVSDRADRCVRELFKVTFDKRIQLEVLFSGDVQGVGFRYTTRQVARKYPVEGYVKNLPDGRVQLVAEGNPPDVRDFVGDVERTMSDYVRQKQIDERPATGEFDGFGIRF